MGGKGNGTAGLLKLLLSVLSSSRSKPSASCETLLLVVMVSLLVQSKETLVGSKSSLLSSFVSEIPAFGMEYPGGMSLLEKVSTTV